MNNKEKVLVTGASGFVGSAVAGDWLKSGFSVRALVRGTSPRAHLAGLDFEFFEGDIRDRKSSRARSGGHALHFSRGGRLSPMGARSERDFCLQCRRHPQPHGRGDACERRARFYTSSVATIALRSDGMAADETTPLRENEGIGAYKRSKIAAERMVEAMVTERGLAAVIVNPSTPIGPRDVRPTPTGRIIVEAARGRIPAFINTGLNLVHVDDVASGHLAHCITVRSETLHSRRPERLFSQMLSDIAGFVGRRAARVQLPWRALVPVAFFAEAVASVTGREPFATLDRSLHGETTHVLRFDQSRTGAFIPFSALRRGN